MTRTGKILFLGLAPLLLAGSLCAETSLGGERVATNAGGFLKIGVGAKAVGLGEAFTAVADDATTVFWNPAGLTNLTGREIHVSHTSWFADIDYEYIAYAQELPYLGGLNAGLHLGTLRTALMETTEYEPYGTGREFTYSDLFIGAAAARRFTDKLSIGLGAKYIRENYGAAIGGPVVNTWAADFGTFYKIGFQDAVFAVAFLNFGPSWKPSGTFYEFEGSDVAREREFEHFAPPTSFKAALSGKILETSEIRWIGVVEMNRPPDNSESFKFATEATYRKILALRTGYNLKADELKWSGGLGVVLDTGGMTDRFDYAFTYSKYLGRVDRVSLGVGF